MQSSKTSRRIIISGGGTGGHIYPAIAIADEIRRRDPDAEILFVGALGRMEMEKVPKAGYKIRGIPISGIDRSNLFSNFKFPFKLIKSLGISKKIIEDFNPDAAVGTGGYASGPLLWKAAKKKIPFLIQEQNSFPGITNRLLKNKAGAICVAYDGIAQFPGAKTHHTGNPIRAELFQNLPKREEAKKELGFDPAKKLIFSVGGSQGSRTLNNAWEAQWKVLTENDIQLLWQTGSLDYKKIKAALGTDAAGIRAEEFIYDMKTAYAAADLIVSRAGAMAISELELVGKPIILVPFPFAAEDHQTKNAEALLKKEAALMLTDGEVPGELVKTAIALLKDEEKQKRLGENLKNMGQPDATKDIVDILFELIG